jgi:hypothetical protein
MYERIKQRFDNLNNTKIKDIPFGLRYDISPVGPTCQLSTGNLAVEDLR